MSVDLGTVTSGANWLLERQGSGGEWAEVEMFPDLDQVERANIFGGKYIFSSPNPNTFLSHFCFHPCLTPSFRLQLSFNRQQLQLKW